MPKVRLSFFVLFFSLLVAAPSARAQDEDVVRVGVNLVQLNVGVTDRRGRPVTDLTPNEFIVYEDGVPQRIVSFEPTETPFSLVLLLDMSGSTLNFRTTLKQAAWRFIDALAPDDRVAVVAFNDRTRLLAKFTSDRKKIAWAIERAEGRGETQLYRALGYALELLAQEGKRRKAIVVLTDGLDTELRNADRASSVEARTDAEAIARLKPESSPLLNAVLDAADRQGVTIYPLALASGDPKRLPIATPQITAIYTAARQRLQILADRTGGRLHQINRLEDLGRLYAEVAADLRTLYSIAYQPAGDRPRDGSWRSIRVEVKRPDLIARTRQGYYAR
ncbi:MAG: hypothetical protein C4334_11700 [Pyrinomonas sp.]|uniref:VWA domain-containing protein n=1 Tax=Pyrinomonas sp. TaxID=2080306 RepID=UPI003320E5FD